MPVVADCLFLAALCCFPKPEPKNLNLLVLIPFCLARARPANRELATSGRAFAADLLQVQQLLTFMTISGGGSLPFRVAGATGPVITSAAGERAQQERGVSR